MEHSRSRPKRLCASRQYAKPSAVHYVGYVEDEETPEMIMKKFEELERVRATSKPSASDSGPVEDSEDSKQQDIADSAGPADELTDEQLLEVFRQTSSFNVKGALAGNALEEELERWSEEDDSEDGEHWADIKHFWSDEEDTTYKAKTRTTAAPRKKVERGISLGKTRHELITSYNTATRALIRRRVQVPDNDALLQIRVPHPLPLAWGQTVSPYVPAELRSRNLPEHSVIESTVVDGGRGSGDSNSCFEQENIYLMDWKLLKKPFQHQISSIVAQMNKWRYIYVESLTWIFLHRNNRILRLPSAHLNRSHLTLFVFRREGQGRDIELRHQRKPDVIFESIRHLEGKDFIPPREAYVTIETMLPSGHGHFLELWAPKGSRRPGWCHVSEIS